MQAPAIDQLTDAQRECLRLVYAHHSSKEIAEIVGVSPSAIDKRLERAVQMLGVSSRFAAARLLATAEGQTAAYERTPSDTIDLPSGAFPARSHDSGEPWRLVRRLFGLSPEGGSEGIVRNPLGRLERLGVIVGLIFLIAMSSVALLNLGQTLSSMAAEARSVPGR